MNAMSLLHSLRNLNEQNEFIAFAQEAGPVEKKSIAVIQTLELE